jgi:CO/xanthine dehydrogenase Mo-binding subunit
VEVDDETGEVEVLRIVASHDCGTAINPMLVEGQVEGGVSMGIGFALSEEVITPTAAAQPEPDQLRGAHHTDVPHVEVVIVTYDPLALRRQKAWGADPAPTAAAVANAIYDAVGADHLAAGHPEKICALRAKCDQPGEES